jgi:SAM-dependent methyltransferase
MSENPKAQAWDALGLKYYFLGRRSAKPSPSTVRWFTDGVGPEGRCLVVGGTSVGVIRAATRSGCPVVVADFSPRVCADLRQELSGAVTIVQRDVLQPAPDWDGGFTHLLCDALVNRFDDEEARRFERQAARVLRPGGVLRATVQLGLYPMELRLMEIAPGEIQGFWDERTRTIDYGRIGDLLERVIAPHGDISRHDLLEWYRHRGREKRFDEKDLCDLFGPPAWAPVELAPDDPASDRVRLAARRTDR